jgi:predicted metal-dependent phosphoesterase TrpH
LLDQEIGAVYVTHSFTAMIHRFDLHVHSWFSADAAHEPEALIAAARAAGLSGIAITDHDTCAVHEYLLSKGLERADGLPVDGFLVIPGVEVSTAQGHLLCLGTTLPWMKHEPVEKVLKAVEERGGFAAPAHPYDGWRAGIREHVLETLPLEAIEIFNAAVTSRSYNEKARVYAEKRGLLGLAGSDAHHSGAVGMAVTELDIPELSVAAVLAGLRAGKVRLDARYLSRWQGIQKHFANWFRFTKTHRPPSSQ